MKKSALITGASSGLGQALAWIMANEGYTLILHGRNARDLETTAAKCPNSKVIVGDLTNPEEPLRIVAAVGKTPTVLVNAAGFLVDGSFTDVKAEDFEACFRVGFQAPVELIRYFLPEMKRRKAGIIVNITSGVAFRGLPFTSSYSAAKAALHTFSDSLRLELAGAGVRMISFSPGPIASRFQENAKRVSRAHTPEHGQTPTEVAKILFERIKYGPDQTVLGSKARLARLLGAVTPRLTDWLVSKTST